MSLTHEEKLARQRGYWHKHAEKRRAAQNDARARNPEKARAQDREYRERNKALIAERNRIQYLKNKPVRMAYAKKWNAQKRSTDPLFRLKSSIRTRTNDAVRRGGFTKLSSMSVVLGCDWAALKLHLEALFTPWMTWANYGSAWVIDHHVPLASARDEVELMRLCHYTNLRPLGKVENLRKAAKMPAGDT